MAWWIPTDRPCILASQSPRRQEILSRLGVHFTVMPPQDVDETVLVGAADLQESLGELALIKARDVARRRGDALVLGADTVVVCGTRVLGKPRDAREAGEMVELLSGRTHNVLTGVGLVCEACGFERTGLAVTRVRFREVDPPEIAEYLAQGDFTDKAGAYAIQGAAMRFVDGIDGCYYNVVGLPVTVTINLFKEYCARKDTSDGRHAG